MIELQDLLPYTKKLKLLCIDSDAAVRQSLVKTFSKIFSQVDDAADGYDGLNHFKINQHDLIITESSLDNYPALQMVEQIKKISPAQHIIVISNQQDAATLMAWTNMGIQGFIPKPIVMQNLLESMHKSCSVLYSNAQKLQQVEASSQVKEQKKQLQAHYEQNEHKLQEALAYEKKRLGRLLGQERALQNKLNENEEKMHSIRFKDDLTGLKKQIRFERLYGQRRSQGPSVFKH